MKSNLSRGANALTLAVLIIALGSCGLPRSGPNKREIYAGSVLKKGDAFVVEVNPRVSQITAVAPSFGFDSNFRNAGLVGSDTISPGDTLALTVFENVKEDPLLGNSGQRVTPLNEMQVDGQGFIFVPYAGKIKAAGQTPDGLLGLDKSKYCSGPIRLGALNFSEKYTLFLSVEKSEAVSIMTAY